MLSTSALKGRPRSRDCAREWPPSMVKARLMPRQLALPPPPHTLETEENLDFPTTTDVYAFDDNVDRFQAPVPEFTQEQVAMLTKSLHKSMRQTSSIFGEQAEVLKKEVASQVEAIGSKVHLEQLRLLQQLQRLSTGGACNGNGMSMLELPNSVLQTGVDGARRPRVQLAFNGDTSTGENSTPTATTVMTAKSGTSPSGRPSSRAWSRGREQLFNNRPTTPVEQGRPGSATKAWFAWNKSKSLNEEYPSEFSQMSLPNDAPPSLGGNPRNGERQPSKWSRNQPPDVYMSEISKLREKVREVEWVNHQRKTRPMVQIGFDNVPSDESTPKQRGNPQQPSRQSIQPTRDSQPPARVSRVGRARRSVGDFMQQLIAEAPLLEEEEEKKKKRGVFMSKSKEEMKKQVRQALSKPVYNVHDFYKEWGMAQRIAKSNVFEMFTLAVVAFNSVWLMIDADQNQEAILANAHVAFQVAEHSFCTFFVFELVIRFLAFRRTKYALSDGWFLFDTILVSLMVAETWVLNTILYYAAGAHVVTADASVLKIVRMARLIRMTRMVRLLRWMPELVVLLKGLGLASRSVFFTLVLLCMIVYVFALTFRQLTSFDSFHCEECIGTVYFRTVPESFSSLLFRGTLPDVADFIYDVAAESYFLGVLFCIFTLLAFVTVMNMLVGVLVEVVSTVSAIENESMTVNHVRQKMILMMTHLEELDRRDDMLSKEDFESLLVNPDAAQFMQDVGVDVVGLVEFSDFIFRDRELHFHEFVELILQLRGSNNATVKDLVDMRRFVTMELENTVRVVKKISDDAFEGLAEELSGALLEGKRASKLGLGVERNTGWPPEVAGTSADPAGSPAHGSAQDRQQGTTVRCSTCGQAATREGDVVVMNCMCSSL